MVLKIFKFQFKVFGKNLFILKSKIIKIMNIFKQIRILLLSDVFFDKERITLDHRTWWKI